MTTPPEAVSAEEKSLAAAAGARPSRSTIERKSWVAPTLARLSEYASSHDYLVDMDRQGFSRNPLGYLNSAECRALSTARVALSRRMDDFVDTVLAAGALLHIRWAA